MKLSHILEAKYVGANRYFCIVWGPATIAYFDFGVTSAIAGSYASPDVTVVVAMSKEKALARAKEFIDSDGLKDWQFKRWYGELNTLSLSDKDVWDFYKPGERYRDELTARKAARKKKSLHRWSVTEARYYRNRPTADQVADMYDDVKENGIVDRWDRISLGTPRLYEQPVVRILAEVTIRDEQKAVQYIKRFLKSNNLPYTEISSEHGEYYTGWEIDIIYKEGSSQVTEARYASPTRTFIVAWPNLDWAPGDTVTETFYDVGETKAPPGVYVREDQIVIVADDEQKALEEYRKTVKDYEGKEFGAPLPLIQTPTRKRVTQHFLDEVGLSLEKRTEWSWNWQFEPLGTKMGVRGLYYGD